MARKRPIVLSVRLSEKEKNIYDKLADESLKHFRGKGFSNESERFRAVLKVMDVFLKDKAYATYWLNLEID